jgi:hypothetical protein
MDEIIWEGYLDGWGETSQGGLCLNYTFQIWNEISLIFHLRHCQRYRPLNTVDPLLTDTVNHKSR